MKYFIQIKKLNSLFIIRINNIFIKKNGEKFRDFILQDIKELYDSFLIFHMVFVFYKYIQLKNEVQSEAFILL